MDPSYPPPQGQYPGYPPGPGFAPGAPPPGYPPVGQPGYPPPGQPGYPPGQPGYPPPGQPGYPSPGGYPPPSYPQPGQPIMTAPGPAAWMPMPTEAPPNCPPGLEYLMSVDTLLVHQKTELLEAMTGFETENEYEVKNVMGQRIYFAKEDSNFCMRTCCGPTRSFEMVIVDNSGREVIHISRPYNCSCCCGFPCPQELIVQSPPGVRVGSIKQDWSIFSPTFSIKDDQGKTVLKIKGPCCCCMFGNVKFEVTAKDGSTKVGRVTKQWTNVVQESFTDADNFGINFPIDLDVKIKAVLLGAVFLIDFMYFEQSANQKNH